MRKVQVYHHLQHWQQVTAVGTPVLHAGAIVGDEIIYCHGAYRNLVKRPRILSLHTSAARPDRSERKSDQISGHASRASHAGIASRPVLHCVCGTVCFVGGTDNPL